MTSYSGQFASTPILLAQAHGPSDTGHQETAPAQHHTGETVHESPWVFFQFSLVALVAISLVIIVGTRRMTQVPSRLQNAMEMLTEALYAIPVMIMGERGRAYAPFVGTFFLYIVVMNFMGLLPWFKPPTANLSISLGMSIVAFVGVQYYGFKAHGWGYLKHFLGPVPAMAFLILPLEIISEFARPLSLSMRLYGNIYGEEQVVTALATTFNPAVALFMLPFQVLTVFLQAFVFTLLVTVYISLATEHAEGEAHGASSKAAAH